MRRRLPVARTAPSRWSGPARCSQNGVGRRSRARRLEEHRPEWDLLPTSEDKRDLGGDDVVEDAAAPARIDRSRLELEARVALERSPSLSSRREFGSRPRRTTAAPIGPPAPPGRAWRRTAGAGRRRALRPSARARASSIWIHARLDRRSEPGRVLVEARTRRDHAVGLLRIGRRGPCRVPPEIPAWYSSSLSQFFATSVVVSSAPTVRETASDVSGAGLHRAPSKDEDRPAARRDEFGGLP